VAGAHPAGRKPGRWLSFNAVSAVWSATPDLD
jgi:hypothetical protein